MADYLKKEDYEERACPLCMNKEGQESDMKGAVPVGRIIEKLDDYLNHNETENARRHLEYWLSEADALNDRRGALAVLDEMMGFYRKNGEKENALNAAKRAFELVKRLGLENSVTGGMIYLNAGTVYKNFDNIIKAEDCYRKAEEILVKFLNSDDTRLGGLYNNYALVLADKKEYEKAKELYFKAIKIMEKAENGLLDVAISYLNLADLYFAKEGAEKSEEKVNELLNKAENCLEDKRNNRNGYFAFVCSKCAEVFDYYGRFFYADTLRKYAEECYERT